MLLPGDGAIVSRQQTSLRSDARSVWCRASLQGTATSLFCQETQNLHVGLPAVPRLLARPQLRGPRRRAGSGGRYSRRSCFRPLFVLRGRRPECVVVFTLLRLHLRHSAPDKSVLNQRTNTSAGRLPPLRSTVTFHVASIFRGDV